MYLINHKITKDNFFLLILISISLIVILFNVYDFVIERSANQYTDWLINYQGGFVRRGLVGEMLFQVYKITNFRLDLIILTFVWSLYILFSINFFIILKKIKLNFLNLLIIFSPFSFLYPVMDQKVSGRKDILLIFFFTFVSIFLRKIHFRYHKFIIIFLSVLAFYSHTGYIFFIPILLCLYLLTNISKPIKKLFLDSLIIIFTIFIFFIFVFLNKSLNLENIGMICDSVKSFAPPNCGVNDYLSTLSWSLERNLVLKYKIWSDDYYNLFYFLAFVICFLPLFFSISFSKFTKKININLLLILSIILICTLPIYYVGADYGRYLHITYLGLLIIYFKAVREKIIITNLPKFRILKNFKLGKQIMIVLIFLYGFTWTVPHCCDSNFKFVYSKITKKIINKF